MLRIAKTDNFFSPLVIIIILISINPFISPAYSSVNNVFPSRFSGGWSLEVNGGQGNFLSSPALADLDLDGDMEIILVTSEGTLHAIDSSGKYMWNSSFSDNGTVTYGDKHDGSFHSLVFTSPLVTNLSGGPEPEIVIGSQGGPICFNSTGAILWKTGRKDFTSVSTPSIFEVYGDGYGPGEDIGIALTTQHSNGSHYLEIYSNLGTHLSSTFITNGTGRISTTVVTSDLDDDGDPEDEIVIDVNGTGTFWFIPYENNPFFFHVLNNSIHKGVSYSSPVVADLFGSTEKETIMIENDFNGTGPIENHTISIYGGRGNLLISKKIDHGGPVTSSAVVADLDGSSDETPSAAMELIYVNLSGFLQVYDLSFSPINLTEKWRFYLGSNCTSSPAICDIDGDLENEIVVASHQGKIYCLDGDPSDGTDEGVPYPGDGPQSDVKWVFDTNNKITTSSPVVADVDGDRQIDIVIGTDSGMLFSLGPSTNCFLDQIDWPTQRGNNRRTGEYILSPRMEVDIRRTNITNTDGIRKIQPGCTTIFNITISTRGYWLREENKFNIDVEVLSPGWKCHTEIPPSHGIENPDFIFLIPNDQKQFQVYIEAPWEGEIGELGRFNISATLSDDKTICDKMVLMAGLDQFVDFELNFLKQASTDPLDPLEGKKWGMITPGDEGIYTISILNKGNVNDTYDLSLNSPPKDLGWDWYFIETNRTTANVSLTSPPFAEQFGGITGTSYTVFVRSPDFFLGGSQIPIKLTVSSRNASILNETLEKEDTLILVVQSYPDFEIEVPDEPIPIFPNYTVEVPIGITNTGNKDLIYVILSIEGKQPGWTVRYPEEPLGVFQGQTRRILIKVSFHEIELGISWKAGNIYPVEISGKSDSLVRNDTFTMYVERISAILTVLNPDTVQYIDPGGSKDYQLLLANGGTGDEVLNLTVDPAIEGDDISISFIDIPSTEMMWLPWGGEILLDFIINVGIKAPMGFHTIIIQLTTESGYFSVIEIKINITHVRSFELITPQDMDSFYLQMEPGEYHSFTVGIKNTGNIGLDIVPMFGRRALSHPDQFTSSNLECTFSFDWISLRGDNSEETRVTFTGENVTVSDLFNGVLYRLEDEIKKGGFDVSIDTGEVLWIGMHFTLPDYNGEKMVPAMSLSFLVKEKVLNLIERFDLGVSVLYPDLTITDVIVKTDENIFMNSSCKVGDVMIITVYVKNIGDVTSLETTVRFNFDEEAYELFDIGPMDPGDLRYFTTNITLGAGYHDISFEVDPLNYVYEKNDQFMEGSQPGANIWKRTFLVEKENEESDGLPLWLALLNIGLVLLLLISASVFLILIRRRSKGPIPNEE